MSPVGDAFTVGIVLLLLIGAVAFYLYTRLTHVEKRIGLLENILLDMRVAMENSFVDFPTPMLKAAGGGKAAQPQTVEEEEAELLSEYVPKLPTATASPGETLEADEQIDTSDYEKILESAHISAEETALTEIAEVDEAVEAEAPEADTTHTIAVSADAQPTATKSAVHVNKLEPNYTSMAVKELRTLAQNRGISGVAKMSRKEIIEALNTKDSGVVDGVEASSAGGFESSLTGNAASVDA